ncbi:MAG: selenium cofactor biosynthesis protein YqeC [Chloroflexi bacterium]|nr:selenium cofactor biosynthesis protein YqeC [Chloroflexota bacterium]MCY3583406.1 selenium cofactor biosynthesis protein YqeC [Chloroflexota bacterium]MCY3715411.1 selenium cofactor biosynthesis protein YqeC [Chloroflexota bacterium]MDE2649620.1 selenium cofactor biosynthesis protein YqeC [Chloroflexota bacterium]MXV92085.1 putative selenium-dependent hydroxylase accessory protein YqeC [Chloroflexota bacterium]
MRLSKAFDIVPGDVVAFIGAGGKTSLLVGLGYELAEAGWRVLATTTTQLSTDQLLLFPRVMSSRDDARAISQALSDDQFVLLHEDIRAGRVYGPPPSWTRDLLDSVDSDILLVEADHAAGLPFKAPRADEPIIPLETSLVVPVASLSALGVPLDDAHIYNPAAMIDRYGFARNTPVKSAWLAQVLRDETLGLRGLPESARVVVYVNQVPAGGYALGRARLIARLCLQNPRIHGVALGSVRGFAPVAELQRALGAIVLSGRAEGGAEKVARTSEQLMRARINHIRVITGAGAAQVCAAVKRLGLRTIHDRRYRRGGAVSALAAGFRALPAHVAAALVLSPQGNFLTPKLVYQLLTAFYRGDGDFIVAGAGQAETALAIIGRRHWADITALPPAASLGAVIQQFQARIALLDTQTGLALPGIEAATVDDRPFWSRSR